MIKTLQNLLKQDKERYTVPKKVQDMIPISCIWNDGIFKVGNKFAKTYKFSDINYMVASREDKESMFLTYSELLNSLDSGATTKITINNHRMNKADFETSILMPMCFLDGVISVLFGEWKRQKDFFPFCFLHCISFLALLRKNIMKLIRVLRESDLLYDLGSRLSP